jgi:hypothetical protein
VAVGMLFVGRTGGQGERPEPDQGGEQVDQ